MVAESLANPPKLEDRHRFSGTRSGSSSADLKDLLGKGFTLYAIKRFSVECLLCETVEPALMTLHTYDHVELWFLTCAVG